jgi:hypothetical protein
MVIHCDSWKETDCSDCAPNFISLKKIQQLQNVKVEFKQNIQLYNVVLLKYSKFILYFVNSTDIWLLYLHWMFHLQL